VAAIGLRIIRSPLSVVNSGLESKITSSSTRTPQSAKRLFKPHSRVGLSVRRIRPARVVRYCRSNSSSKGWKRPVGKADDDEIHPVRHPPAMVRSSVSSSKLRRRSSRAAPRGRGRGSRRRAHLAMAGQEADLLFLRARDVEEGGVIVCSPLNDVRRACSYHRSR